MPIQFGCQVCGEKIATPDELAGKVIRCPTCNNKVGVPMPVLELLAIRAMEEPLVRRAEPTSRRFWHDPVVVIGATVPTVILVAFIAYLVGVNVGSKRGLTDRIDIASASPDSPRRELKAPADGVYQVIDEFHKPSLRPDVGGHRMIHVRLNGKVSEDVLREISVELKAKNTKPFLYTSIDFWLPGKGAGMGPGNRNAWAKAFFNGDNPTVQILGLSIEAEYRYRTDPVFLPDKASEIGIWLLDDGIASEQLVFYRIDDEWRWHSGESDEEKQQYILLKELPDDEGRCLHPTGSTDRYVVLPNGDLKLYNGSGKLLDYVRQQSPSPPIRRTIHPSKKIR